MTRSTLALLLALAACGWQATDLHAQAPPAPAPAQGTPPSPTPAPAPSPPAQAPGGLPTLVPTPGDPVNVDEVTLPEKPTIAIAGSSSWDDGFKSIREALKRLEGELAKLGMAPAGRPLTTFVQTTDDKFTFEAMIPIALVPTPAPALPEGIKFGTTPSGKAYRFVHQGPYDDIDTTYETITSYLDVKDIAAKDQFFEEYVNDVADAKDPKLNVNIFVQPR